MCWKKGDENYIQIAHPRPWPFETGSIELLAILIQVQADSRHWFCLSLMGMICTVTKHMILGVCLQMGRTQYHIYKIIHIYSNHIYIYTHTLQWRKMMINHQLWEVFPKISDPSHHVGTTEPAARATGLGCNGMRHICFLQSLFPAIP